jgi:hypothetical protein
MSKLHLTGDPAVAAAVALQTTCSATFTGSTPSQQQQQQQQQQQTLPALRV